MGSRMTLGLVALAVLSCGGCTYVALRNPATGQTAACGHVPIAPWYSYSRAKAKVLDEVRCMDEHQAQGFQRADVWLR